MPYNNGSIVQLEEQRESFGELLGELAGHSASLVRDEITLARQEFKEKLGAYKNAVMLQLIGGMIGLLSASSLCAAFIIWLGEQIGIGMAATLTGLGLALIAVILLLYARSAFSRSELKPEQTIETLEENKEWLKELA